jgi:glutathione S-transferase
VPTLVIGDTVVSENPAICIFLADRYSYGVLAPKIEEPARGAYLRWMVFSTAVFEPARALAKTKVEQVPQGHWGAGWGTLDEVVDVLIGALDGRDYILGSRFTAADVMVGSAIAVSLFTRQIPDHPVLTGYRDRLTARPAFTRAAEINWPRHLFPPPA